MNKYGYVTVETVIEKVMGITPSNIDYNISEIVEHIYDCVKLLGVKLGLIHEELSVTVSNNKVILPKGIEHIFNIKYESIDLMQVDMYPQLTKDSDKYRNDRCFYYYINNEVLYTDLDDCELILEVVKYPIDEREYPLVPGDFIFVNAIVHYIAERLAYKLYLQDKLNEHKYSRFERERFIHMESAKNYSRIPQTKGEDLNLETSMFKLVESRGRGLHVERRYEKATSFDELSDLISML